MRSSWRWVGYLLGALGILVGAFVIWGSTPLGPEPTALAALPSDGRVTVETGRELVFRPTDGAPVTGLILYPGGRVDYRSYAPVAREIADRGYLVIVPRMPLNLAVLAPERATQIIDRYADIQTWAVGGHSLGGAMAALYAYQHPERVQGLVLWAAYPASNASLAERVDLSVVSIYGTLDGLATEEKIEASRALLPSSTRWVPIEGGNHAQFGWYGAQAGDNPPDITHQRQQFLVAQATASLLKDLIP